MIWVIHRAHLVSVFLLLVCSLMIYIAVQEIRNDFRISIPKIQKESFERMVKSANP